MRAFFFLLLLWVNAASSAEIQYPPATVEVRAEKLTAHSYYIPGLAGAASSRNEGFASGPESLI